MKQETLNLILLLTPILIGGVIAAINSEGVNATTEKAEAWTRRTQSITAQKSGWFSRYLANPILWLIVKFSDWTDGFTHQGIKNGTRVAATLYLIGIWIYLLFAAFMVILTLAIGALILYIVFKVLMNSDNSFKKGYETSQNLFGTNVKSGYSEKKEHLFGGEYTQYYDANGNPVETAEVKERLFGGKYVQYYDQNGNEIGTSELKETLFGGQFEQHYDENGNEIGTSVEKERLFGGKYIQHSDEVGNQTGTSERKERLFGGVYSEHKSEE